MNNLVVTGLTIGESIRTIRMRQKLSQSDVAARSGVCRNTISAIERGDMNVKLSTLIAIAEALGYTVNPTMKKSEP